MKLFSKIAYHSTNQKITEFQPFTSGDKKGEGAMIHGWGLYLQEDKFINTERYKDRLSGDKIFIDFGDGYENVYHAYQKYRETAHYEFNIPSCEKFNICLWILVLLEFDSEKMINIAKDNDTEKLESFILFGYNNPDKFQKVFKELFQTKPDTSVHDWISLIKGIKIENIVMHQYQVEIPDNFVFILEESPIGDTPYYDLLNDLWKSKRDYYINDLLQNMYEISSEFADELNDAYRELINYPNVSPYQAEDKLRPILEKYDCDNEEIITYIYEKINIPDLRKDLTYREFKWDFEDNWERLRISDRDLSNYLYDNGVDGIEYDGYEDGHCYVIFNCKDLKIVKEM